MRIIEVTRMKYSFSFPKRLNPPTQNVFQPAACFYSLKIIRGIYGSNEKISKDSLASISSYKFGE